MKRSLFWMGMAPAVAAADRSSAGTLTSPLIFLGSGDQNVCVAINVGKDPIEVTVEVAGELAQNQDTCTLNPFDPSSTCQAFAADAVFCRVSTNLSQGKTAKSIRAVLMNRDTAPPFTIHTSVDVR
jgi:hypothetical protein